MKLRIVLVILLLLSTQVNAQNPTARYLASPPEVVGTIQNPDGFILLVPVTFLGPRIDDLIQSRIQVEIPFTTTPADMRAAIISAIVAEGTRLGFTVNRNGGLLFTMERGS